MGANPLMTSILEDLLTIENKSLDVGTNEWLAN